jgi:hypothetical protein
VALASICWVQGKQSEREARNPLLSPRYVTVVRFEREAANWPDEAWSLVVEPVDPPGRSNCVVANVRFLAPGAPTHLLTTGNRFELYEGRQCVATGEVLPEQREATESLTA